MRRGGRRGARRGRARPARWGRAAMRHRAARRRGRARACRAAIGRRAATRARRMRSERLATGHFPTTPPRRGGRVRWWCSGSPHSAGLVLYAPFLVAAGPGTVWDALVVQGTQDGAWWRLPFPNGFGGGDAKDFLAWLAPYLALVVLALAVVRREAIGLVVLGAGTAIYFVSRADLEHAQGLLVVAAAAAAFVRPRAVGIALLAVLIAVGVTNRGVALLRPPDLEPFGTVAGPAGGGRGAAAAGRHGPAAGPAGRADLRRAAAQRPGVVLEPAPALPRRTARTSCAATCCCRPSRRSSRTSSRRSSSASRA